MFPPLFLGASAPFRTYPISPTRIRAPPKVFALFQRGSSNFRAFQKKCRSLDQHPRPLPKITRAPTFPVSFAATSRAPIGFFDYLRVLSRFHLFQQVSACSFIAPRVFARFQAPKQNFTTFHEHPRGSTRFKKLHHVSTKLHRFPRDSPRFHFLPYDSVSPITPPRTPTHFHATPRGSTSFYVFPRPPTRILPRHFFREALRCRSALSDFPRAPPDYSRAYALS